VAVAAAVAAAVETPAVVVAAVAVAVETPAAVVAVRSALFLLLLLVGRRLDLVGGCLLGLVWVCGLTYEWPKPPLE